MWMIWEVTSVIWEPGFCWVLKLQHSILEYPHSQLLMIVKSKTESDPEGVEEMELLCSEDILLSYTETDGGSDVQH